MGRFRFGYSSGVEQVSSSRSKRKVKPISSFFKSFFRSIRQRLRTVIKRDNFHSDQYHSYSYRANDTVRPANNSLQFRIVAFGKRRFAARKLLGFFREYSATIVVAVCVVAVALINLSSAKDARGSLFESLGISPKEDTTLKNKIAIQNESKNNLATAPLVEPAYFVNASLPEEEYAEKDAAMLWSAPTIQSQVLLASYNPVVAGNRREMKKYVVNEGDTIGSIAAKHGISTSTILWSNNLSETSIIKPGEKLSILPVTGMKYKVQKGDSLDAIVAKYNSEKQKVLAYNEMPADEKLKEGQELILPDGYISAPAASGPQPTYRTAPYGTSQVQYATAGSAYSMDYRAGAGHRFPYGYCTWYVAQRKYVPWGGNAGAWLANARASGKATGRAPKAGAIIVTGESRWGHVGIVEKVNGNTVTISEMNYAGFGKKSTRTLNASSRIVKGFIY